MKLLKSFAVTVLFFLLISGVVVALDVYPLASGVVLLILIFLWIWNEVYEML